jgi:transcriptional regulator with XRE-family HTH domain
MSQMTESVPEVTGPWRLRIALEHAGLSIDQMAKHLGVSRATVSRWLNGRGGPPTRGYLIAFAMRCGVPLEWLTAGPTPRKQCFSAPASGLRTAA